MSILKTKKKKKTEPNAWLYKTKVEGKILKTALASAEYFVAC